MISRVSGHAYGSLADKPSPAKTHLCPLWSVVSTDRRNTLSLTAKMECLVISQRFRRGFTAAEKTELWERWQRGESLKAIGRACGKPSSSIYCQVAPHGGIRPAPRRRSRLALTLAEREEISRGLRRINRHDRWPGY